MIETIEQGHMTKDLAICVHGTTKVRSGGGSVWLGWVHINPTAKPERRHGGGRTGAGKGRSRSHAGTRAASKRGLKTQRRTALPRCCRFSPPLVWQPHPHPFTPLPPSPPSPPPAPPPLQVTPDQYLNTEPFMDAVADTFAKKRGGKK